MTTDGFREWECIFFRFRDLTVTNETAICVSQPIRRLRVTGCVLLGERVLLDGGGKLGILIHLKEARSFETFSFIVSFIYHNNDRTEEARSWDGGRSRRCEETPDRTGVCSAVPTTLGYGKTESWFRLKKKKAFAHRCINAAYVVVVGLWFTDSNLLNQFTKGICSVNHSGG